MKNKSFTYNMYVPSYNTLEITDDSLYILLVVLRSKKPINVLAINACR